MFAVNIGMMALHPCAFPGAGSNGKSSDMKHVPKETTDEELIKQFLDNGGSVKVGKTKPMPHALGISKNQWNAKLTKEEKDAIDGK